MSLLACHCVWHIIVLLNDLRTARLLCKLMSNSSVWQRHMHVLQVVAVIAWESEQQILAWNCARWHKGLKTEYTVAFRLIDFGHGIFCCFNEGAKHHFSSQAVSYCLKLSQDACYALVAHACTITH